MSNPDHPRAPRRGRVLLAALLALTCFAAAAQSAQAATPLPSEVTCGGHVERGVDEAVPERIDYVFACSDAIKSYTVLSNAPIGSFGVDSQVFQHGTDTIVEADNFFCEGLIPGDGFNCTGATAKGNDVHGHFELSAPVCDETVAGATRPKIQLVIADGKGATAGPFRLRGPEPCAPPVAAATPRRAARRAPLARARAKRKAAARRAAAQR